MTTLWIFGLLRRRPLRLAGTAAGIAVAVALIATLAVFTAQSKATMTARAVRSVAVDWQVQVQPQANPADVAHLVSTDPDVKTSALVGYAHAAGLSAVTGATTQTTGPATVLGVPVGYQSMFPGEIRSMLGASTGVLLAQQTAANLHAAPGDTITVGRAGLPPVTVTVDGVVDLAQANSLFQTVGAPPAAQPSAPPDNVVLLPQGQWHAIFDPLASARPDLVTTQIHVVRQHDLPADPAAAYNFTAAAAHNLEARSAGTALVGDNLGAELGAARSDAAYAQVLFLFLGVPGAVLAALLTATVAAAGAGRRRAEQALLRARGASPRRLLRLAVAEALVTGAVGAVVGLIGAIAVAYLAFGALRFGTTAAATIGWAAGSAVVGVVIALITVVGPARRDLRHSSVASARGEVAAARYPIWARYGLDGAALIAAGLAFLATSRNHYQIVLAPEGTPTISVSYWAFAGPALLWIGAALLTWRLADLVLGRGRNLVRRALAPTAGSLAGVAAGGISRQRRPLVRAIVVLALAIAFAISTATFNATYRQQAEADALLTNGADIAVAFPPSASPGPSAAARLAAVPGVTGVEPLQHRFAYVGADLQDFFAVDPTTITKSTALQDAYFQGGTAKSLMSTLSAHPDSVLVSAETVSAYQLRVGDPITLRLVDANTHQPKPVNFRYVGVVNEFPTAPKDSFFVANAGYVSQQTGSDAVGTFLVDTGGRNTASVAAGLRDLLGTSATVTDIATVRGQVGSSLTSVDLRGLTRVELAYALLLAVAAGALVFALGLAERRRTFAIFAALGAKGGHMRALIGSEAGVLTVLGLGGGAAIGAILSMMLVKVLGGVFDPPPSVIAVPWPYLWALFAITVGGLGAVGTAALTVTRRSAATVLREL
ncbi:FtsX-like permease family protein [Mycobacterium sp.]|uniref:FtsX-like permease family protein n=1 Tax=Mycobacterium sp. TaxID=1785 RepID=UPI002D45208F|nr:FtsX-like permease family protein [Mycobacterium sp.]HZA11413.1 FtsX-like permease family protein [Mycobacterium sp.]